MSINPGTLRAELEARRNSSKTFSFSEAVSVIVPICAEIQQIHGDGKLLFIHPSAIFFTGSAASLLEDKAEDQPGGRNPVRYGDWELKGLAIDF